ncbi:MAG: M1 family metallopeptidase [Chitinophagaceae bacterium]
MKNIFALFTFILISLFVSAQPKIDVVHYRFEIVLTDQSDTISGKAIILVKFLMPIDQFNLDLKSVKSGKGMVIHSMKGNNTEITYLHQQDIISVKPSKKAKPGETQSFIIEYKGVPADGLIISKNKFGHRTFFADNWPDRGRNWIPCIDDPADKASVEFVVIAPLHYQVIANGILVEETNIPGNKKLTHWKEEVPVATKVMVIGAADFAIQLSGMVNECIPVYSWVYPEDKEPGFKDFRLAMDILPFFINYIGEYGYKKLASVQSKTNFGGLENANTIFYNQELVDGSGRSESTQAHEIAHQWFGNMVTEKSFAHLWLSEGFATYLAITYFEKKYGADTARYMLEQDRDQVIDFAKKSNRPVVDNDTYFMGLLNANSYQKGGWILHMLRRQLGETVFHKGIKSFYAAYAGKNADTKDLQNIFEKISGRDLSVFFQQWLYTAGIPRLAVSWNYLTN